jgi:hypothetical protein
MNRTPKVGDLIVTGGHLTRIERIGRVNGADVAYHPGRSDMGGWSPYLAMSPWHCLTYASIGRTVCELPYLAHFCGLTHLPADELDQLRDIEEGAV